MPGMKIVDFTLQNNILLRIPLLCTMSFKFNDASVASRKSDEVNNQGAPGKFSSKFLGPYEIIRVLRGDRYVVLKIGEHEGPKTTSTSADHIKRWLAYEHVSDIDCTDDECNCISTDECNCTSTDECNCISIAECNCISTDASGSDARSEWPSVGTENVTSVGVEERDAYFDVPGSNDGSSHRERPSFVFEDRLFF